MTLDRDEEQEIGSHPRHSDRQLEAEVIKPRYYVKLIGAGWCVCDRYGVKPGEIVYIARHEDEANAALQRITDRS